ncbi:AraC family transcriptional regulator [Aurantiacibacter flavus]|uniref:AraC family transcriptional regulator n=1 Tax=Aurantiacibacter flavus TaxID=3145232 RepID=A0ABV0CS38_9SPHN
MGQSIDLADYDRPARRDAWDHASNSLFPGLRVELAADEALRGSIASVDLGRAHLCAIETPPAQAHHVPTNQHADTWQHVSLMVQPWGRTTLVSACGEIAMAPGDMCMVDERARFRIVTEEFSRLLFLRLPRAAVLGRYPHLNRLCGKLLPASDSGTRLLSDNLQRISEVAAELGDLQRAAVVSSTIHMLGVAQAFAELPESAEWRVRRAADFIEMSLSVTGITASDIAEEQGISRRRLDQLMKQARGVSISGYLWQRRMEQSAADLADPHKAALSIAQIAFANGYEDAAHFTRAFRRSFGTTPGRWRDQAVASSVAH